MSAISGYINQIQNAVYGEQVRTAIINALQACYSDVENPDLQSEAFQTAIEAAYQDGFLDIIEVLQVSQMTNENIIYRYMGTESGYIANTLYYYNGTEWAPISKPTDKTLTISGAPADAKAVGDKFIELSGTGDLSENFVYENGKYIANDGTIAANSFFHYVKFFEVESGTTYSFAYRQMISSLSYVRVVGYDENKDFVECIEEISHDVAAEYSVDVEIPSTVKYLQISIPNTFPILYFRKKDATLNLHKFNFSEAECRTAFKNAVAEKCSRIGMNNSTFLSPSGLTTSNRTTAKDELKMLIEACSFNDLLKIWDKDEWTITTLDGTEIDVESSVYNATFESYYTLLGGKTGTLSYTGDDAQPGAICAICSNSYNDLFACVILNATNDSKRWTALKQLMDIATSAKHDESFDISTATVTDALCAIVCEVPQIPAMWQSHTPTIIFEQNATLSKPPASTSKVMAAITGLDYIENMHEYVEIVASDIEAGSGNVFSAGDIVTVEDLLFAMMLPSSNTAAQVFARLAGDYILRG